MWCCCQPELWCGHCVSSRNGNRLRSLCSSNGIRYRRYLWLPYQPRHYPWCFPEWSYELKGLWHVHALPAIGAIIAAALLAFLVSTDPGLARGTATGANACASENVLNGLCAEIVLTFIFVLVVLGATAKTNGATNNFAGLAIGLALIPIHLVGINYTGTSVNPARSIGPALFEGGKALAQLWVFIVGPFIGGALAACVWKLIDTEEK